MTKLEMHKDFINRGILPEAVSFGDPHSAYVVYFEADESGGFTVTCPEFPGCITQGNNTIEAVENIQEAILLCLQDDV